MGLTRRSEMCRYSGLIPSPELIRGGRRTDAKSSQSLKGPYHHPHSRLQSGTLDAVGGITPIPVCGPLNPKASLERTRGLSWGPLKAGPNPQIGTPCSNFARLNLPSGGSARYGQHGKLRRTQWKGPHGRSTPHRRRGPSASRCTSPAAAAAPRPHPPSRALRPPPG